MKRLHCIPLLALLLPWTFRSALQAQTVAPQALTDAPPLLKAREVAGAAASENLTVPLVVPKGLPLLIALDREVRVREPGQPIHGKTVQPAYAFDRIVIPAGTEAAGHIRRIHDVPGKERTLSALDADFSPAHRLEIEFDELILPDGKRLAVRTTVAPGSGQVMEFVQAKENEGKKGVKSAASEKIDQAKQDAKRAWEEAMKQVHEPGRMHRLEHYLIAQLPIHPQYLEAGTLYFAELQEPLDFGVTPLTPKLAASLTRELPPDSLVHALLVTPLSSATSRREDEVEAMIWQPLFDGPDLILPAGSRLKGSVLQAEPARKMHHNGQLRIAFHGLVAPDGLGQRVTASLVGVAASKAQHVQLDSEGGAQSTTPNSRYLSSAIAVTLAAASSRTDTDARYGGGASGDASTRAAGGVVGFKLIGMAVGAFVHSQPLGLAMGAYGASLSLYRNFISRGGELVFPKDTAMEITIGTRPSGPAAKPPSEAPSK